MHAKQLKQAPWPEIERHINAITGEDQRLIQVEEILGGDINQAFRADTEFYSYFVKLNKAKYANMFEAEFFGLESLGEAAPKAISTGVSQPFSFLVMEYLPLDRSGAVNPSTGATLANTLVYLHQHTHEKYGWQRGNYIGTTPQSNKFQQEWSVFWWNERLLPQLELSRHLVGNQLWQYLKRIKNTTEQLLFNYTPTPRLCHGDLWSGNKGITDIGTVYLFDPAPYYGDRETDIAMTELFGGFDQTFYDHYYRHFPKREGYSERKKLYNLYHILNHANLFNGNYISQAQRMMDDICD